MLVLVFIFAWLLHNFFSGTFIAFLAIFVIIERIVVRRNTENEILTSSIVRPPPSPREKRTGSVTFEDCDIFYEVKGDGPGKPILLMISGGLGDAVFWTYMGDILGDSFTVVSYDRRGNSRSLLRVLNSKPFSLAQQAADALAVLDAAVPDSSRDVYVVGNSGGGLIALELAICHPRRFCGIIAHEAPLFDVLPTRKLWRGFFLCLWYCAKYFSVNIAFLCFALTLRIPFDRKKQKWLPPEMARLANNKSIFMTQEILGYAYYKPDIEKLKREKPPLVLATGAYTIERGLFYGVPTSLLSQELGIPALIFPGDHLSYLNMPWAWAETLHESLRQMMAARKGLKLEN